MEDHQADNMDIKTKENLIQNTCREISTSSTPLSEKTVSNRTFGKYLHSCEDRFSQIGIKTYYMSLQARKEYTNLV
jgi:hypothetical protein